MLRSPPSSAAWVLKTWQAHRPSSHRETSGRVGALPLYPLALGCSWAPGTAPRRTPASPRDCSLPHPCIPQGVPSCRASSAQTLQGGWGLTAPPNTFTPPGCRSSVSASWGSEYFHLRWHGRHGQAGAFPKGTPGVDAGGWGAVHGESVCSFCREPDTALESERHVHTAAGDPAEAGGPPLSAPRGRLLPPPRSTQSVSNFRPQAPAAELPATTLGSPQNRRAEPRRRSFRGPWSLPLQGSEAWRPVTSALGRVRSRVEPRCPCTRPSQALGPGPQGEAGAPGREVTRHPRPHLGAPSASSAPQPWASRLNQPVHSAGFPPSTLGERGKYSQGIKSSRGIPYTVPGSCPHDPRHR